jgi:hypothetical protein
MSMDGSVGSPQGQPVNASTSASTPSRYFSRGSTSRVVIAHPCPALVVIAKAAEATTDPMSASSRATNADLPPSSRKTRLMVVAPAVMTRVPVAVEPVNEIMSTRGSS